MTFHLVALGEHGKVVTRKKFSRKQLLAYTANMPASLVGMECCSGAHFIGAALRDQGHDIRLIPAQFVKPFLKSNKNDFLDAEAIAEAVARQNMRFVLLHPLLAIRKVSEAKRSDFPLCHRTMSMNSQPATYCALLTT
jgi:transposase